MLGQRFITALTPGVRVMVILLSAVYFLAMAGSLTHAFDLSRWLVADSPDFWHGQIWRMVSYVLLPAGIMDFVVNVIVLILLGSMLERHWTRGELWLYCAVAAAGAGLVAVILSPVFVTGAAPMTFGLLVAWAFVSGHEIILVPLFGQTTVRRMVLVLAAVSCLTVIFSAGLTRAMITVSGGLLGWLYLWLCHKMLLSRPARTVQSERINRLEL